MIIIKIFISTFFATILTFQSLKQVKVANGYGNLSTMIYECKEIAAIVSRLDNNVYSCFAFEEGLKFKLISQFIE